MKVNKNIFIIPSWYPSDSNPVTGIFFREESKAYARNYPTENIAISSWGQNNEDFLLWARKPFTSLFKLIRFNSESVTQTKISDNCIEYYTPALSWSRRILRGNIHQILRANEKNIEAFQMEFGKVDLIHAHIAYPGGLIAKKLSENFRIPFIITENQSPFPFRSFLNKKNQLIPLLMDSYNHSHINVAVSRYMERKMKNFKITNSTYIPNYVNENEFTLDPQKQRTSDILFVGRLEFQKGPDILFEALEKLDIRDLSIKVVGEGSMLKRLKIKSKNKKYKATWLGNVGQDKVVEMLLESNFLVLPSRHEGLPFIIIEAMACGLPVISTRCGGPEEMITEETGILIEPENPEQLAKAIEYMIEHRSKYDAQKIRDHFLKNYSSKVVCQKLRKLYEKVIEEHQSKPQ